MPAIRRCPVPSDPVELTKQIKAASDIVAVVVVVSRPSNPPARSSRHSAPSTTTPAPRSTSTPSASATSAGRAARTATSFAFVMHMEKVGVPRGAGHTRHPRRNQARRQGSRPQDHHRTRLLEVMRWAQAKYQHCLLERVEGEAARKYLGGRKLSGKTVRDFGLGFAPLAGDWLVQARRRGRHRRTTCWSRSG